MGHDPSSNENNFSIECRVDLDMESGGLMDGGWGSYSSKLCCVSSLNLEEKNEGLELREMEAYFQLFQRREIGKN